VHGRLWLPDRRELPFFLPQAATQSSQRFGRPLEWKTNWRTPLVGFGCLRSRPALLTCGARSLIPPKPTGALRCPATLWRPGLP
jgi:hypothetical protein